MPFVPLVFATVVSENEITGYEKIELVNKPFVVHQGRSHVGGSKAKHFYFVHYISLVPRLDCAKPADSICLGATMSYARARAAAEKLCKLLDAPLKDSALGERVLRDAHELDKPLVQKLHHSLGQHPLPRVPEHYRYSCARRPQGVVLRIPPPRLTLTTDFEDPYGLQSFGILLTTFLLILLCPFSGAVDAKYYPYIIAGAYILQFVVFALWGFLISRATCTITVGRQRVRVRMHYFIFSLSKVFPVDQVEEIRLVTLPRPGTRSINKTSNSMTIVSDKAAVMFGRELSLPELRLLRQVLYCAIMQEWMGYAAAAPSQSNHR